LTVENFDGAVQLANKGVARDPKNPYLHIVAGLALEKNGQYEKAGQHYDEAIRLDSSLPGGYAQKACLLAACPDANGRDGQKAVEFARKACELSHWKEPSHLIVVAIAYAESGQFDEAVRFTEQARHWG